MSTRTLPPSKVVNVDDGALSYLIKPEGSSGMGLRVTINPQKLGVKIERLTL